MTATPLVALGWAWLVLVLFELRWPVGTGALFIAVQHLKAESFPPAGDVMRNLLRIGWGFAAGAAIQAGLAGSGWITAAWVTQLRNRQPATRLLLAGALGFGAGGMALVGVALAGILFPSVVVVIAVFLLVTTGPRIVQALTATARGTAEAANGCRGAWIAAGVALAVPMLLLPAALAPETDPLRDSLQHNLAVAGQAARLHKLMPMPGNFVFSMPPLMEMVRAAGFAIQGEGAARLQNWWVTAATALVMGAVLSPAIGSGAAWLASVLYVTHPLVAGYTAISKTDAVLAPLGLATALCILDWSSAGRMASAALAGLILGIMAAAKTTAGIYFPLLAAGLAVGSRGSASRRCGAIVLAGAAFGVALLPGWAHNALETRNPMYPFAGRVFGLYDMLPGEWTAAFRYAREVGQHGHYGSALERFASPWTLSFADGFPPLWLAAWPAAAITVRRMPVLIGWLWIAVAGFAGWAAVVPKLHYLFPLLAVGVVPVAIALAGQMGGRTPFATLATRVTIIVVVATQAVRSLTAAPYLESLRAGTGLEMPGSYVARRLPVFADACAATQLLVRGGSPRILLVGERQAYPLIRDHRILLAASTQPFPLYSAIRASDTPRALGRRIRQLGITHVLHNFTTESFERGYQRRPWSPRDLAVWGRYWRGHARLLYRSTRLDPDYGWFLLYELGTLPREATVSLPGVVGVVSSAEEAAAVGRFDTARRTMRLLADQLGVFATIQNAEGTYMLAHGTTAEAYRWLEACRRQGLVHPGLFEPLISIALERGDFRAAVRDAAAMVRAYPELVEIGRVRELLAALSGRPPAPSVDRAELGVVLDFAFGEARRTNYSYLVGLVDSVRANYRR